MSVVRLGRELVFPCPEQAEPDGLLAVGGDLSPERLLTAYAQGIFPWYGEGLPILWHSPDPRTVLLPERLHVPRSLRRTLRKGTFRVRLDHAFARVIERCAHVRRADADGTWITDEMREAYLRLHELGFAHSVEAWDEDGLAGGLYGVSLGGAFFGESMYAERDDASKVAFVRLVEQLVRWDFDWIDCQVHTEHLARFGAEAWPRRRFLDALARTLEKPTRRGTWRFDPELEASWTRS
ncbi:MAG: leucyl/phenylalanyl-tRNA--protein transferase [Myxococcota bacterium]